MNYPTIELLTGRKILSIEGATPGSENIIFNTDIGPLELTHFQDCCESVSVEDIVGDPTDLVGAIVVLAEERSQNVDFPNNCDSVTYTFYEIRTTRGDITIRWCGSSNGYYSESVDITLTPGSKHWTSRSDTAFEKWKNALKLLS